MQNLLSRWDAMCKKITDRSSSVKILGELNRASSILRDVLMILLLVSKFDEELYNQTKDYLQEIAPSKQSIVKFYQSNDTPIFEIQHRETDQDFIWKTVSMSKGAYLIIEHTEALHVIDVNSGNRSNKASNQEDTAWRST
jgi:ribonuclease G